MSTRTSRIATAFAVAGLAGTGAIVWWVLAGAPPVPSASGGRTPSRPAIVDRPAPSPPSAPQPEPGTEPQAEPDAAHGPGVAGTVLLRDGGPAAGAEVVLLARADRTDRDDDARDVDAAADAAPARALPPLEDLFGTTRRGADAFAPAAPETPEPTDDALHRVATAITNDRGGFLLAATGPGPFRVEAFLAGAGHGVRDGVIPDGAPLVLRLGSAVEFRGLALEGVRRTPVPGATVELRTTGTVLRAEAAEDGTFLLRDVEEGTYDLVARAPGHAVVRMEDVPAAPDGAPVEVLFTPGFALEVTVLRGEDRPLRPGRVPPPGGPPLEGASVVALHRDTGTVVSAVTGPAGTARLEHLAPGGWRVVAHADGHGLGLERRLTFREGDTPLSSVELRLAPLVEKTVRVLDANGNPVAGARAYWASEYGSLDLDRSAAAGVSDARGELRIAFDERLERRSVLWIVPAGSAAFLLDPEDPRSAEEEKAVVGPGRVVAGTVTDGTGAPVAGAGVQIEVEPEGGLAGLLVATRTDASGRYESPRLPFGKLLVSVESDAGFDDAERDSTLKDDPVVLDFRLDDPWR